MSLMIVIMFGLCAGRNATSLVYWLCGSGRQCSRCCGREASVAGELKQIGQRLPTTQYTHTLAYTSASAFSDAHTVVWLRVELWAY